MEQTKPRKQKYIFENGAISYQNVKQIIKENMECIIENKRDYFDDEAAEVAFTALGSMNEQQQEKFLEFVIFVDRKMNFSGQGNQNRAHKVQTILAGAIYYGEYFEMITQYGLKEQMALAQFSIIQPLSFYENAERDYPKELLKEISKRERDYSFCQWYLSLVEKYLEEGWNQDQIQNHIKTAKREDLHQEYIEYDSKLMAELWCEEVRKDESRRF